MSGLGEERLAEWLGAYLDNELEAEARADVEALLARDAEARALLAALEAAQPALEGLLAAALAEPVPERLVALVEGRAPPSAAGAAVRPAPGRRSVLDAQRAARGTGDEATAAGAAVRPAPGRRSVLDAQRAARGTGDEATAAGGAIVAFPARRRPVVRALGRLAAGLALLAAGGAGGWLAGQRQAEERLLASRPAPPTWLAQVAQYHRVYAREDRHLVEVPAAEAAHIQDWLTRRLGLRLKVPDLAAQGLVFKGARLLVANGQPVAQLMYLPAAAGTGPGPAEPRAVGFCFTRTGRPELPPTRRVDDDLYLVEWRAGGYAFVVLGWQDPAFLAGTADAIRAQVGI